MHLKSIIVPNKEEPHGLWAIQHTGETSSDFSKLLGQNGQWFDQRYLREFFTNNEKDLSNYQWPKKYPDGIIVPVAAFDTVQYAMELNRTLRDVAERSGRGETPDFDQFFNNYDNSQLGLRELNLSKKQHPIKDGWLRLYAVAICSTCYVITGGAIKLVKGMDRPHLRQEDQKMKKVQAWLKDCDVVDWDSFKDFLNNG